MNWSEPPDREAIAAASRQLTILQLAITVGPILFGIVVAFVVPEGSAPSGGGEKFVRMATLVHLVLALSCYGVIATGVLRTAIGKSGLAPLARIRSERIVHLALAEGPALFGWVVCVLAKSSAVLGEHPVYWANAASTFVLVVYSVLTLPTAESLSERVRAEGGA